MPHKARIIYPEKNYILKEAQGQCKDALIWMWAENNTQAYLALQNPLGLVDDFILSITEAKPSPAFLTEAYDLLAKTYRQLNPDNQLEFVWDGRSQFQKFQDDWTSWFHNQTARLSSNTKINRVVLKGCMLDPSLNSSFLSKDLSRAITRQFQPKNRKWQSRKIA
ncbi:MAG: hypothetical protein KI790_20920 [Cyclobacteriaceae bacterium]|nr:hypothetical protein [Cyclobacteriaceae bacterium HetDA_MAG_MS6]